MDTQTSTAHMFILRSKRSTPRIDFGRVMLIVMSACQRQPCLETERPWERRRDWGGYIESVGERGERGERGEGGGLEEGVERVERVERAWRPRRPRLILFWPSVPQR